MDLKHSGAPPELPVTLYFTMDANNRPHKRPRASPVKTEPKPTVSPPTVSPPTGHPYTGTRYLTILVSSTKSGMTLWQFDKSSTTKGDEIEAFFDHLFNHDFVSGVGRGKKWVSNAPGMWILDIMLHIALINGNSRDITRQRRLEMHPGLNFPGRWTKEDWGVIDQVKGLEYQPGVATKLYPVIVPPEGERV